MALDDTYQPPVTYPIRPLNKGMIRNLPSNGIPEGSFLRIQNYRVHEYGLKRRGGYSPFNTNEGDTETTSYNEQLSSLIYYWSSLANPEMLLLGDKHLMQITDNGQNILKIYANAGSAFNAVTVNAYDPDLFTIEIEITCTEDESTRMYPGSDLFFLDFSDGDAEIFLGTILKNNYGTTTTLLTIDAGITSPAVLPLVEDSFLIRESFVTTDNMGVSEAVLPPSTYGDSGKVIIADQGGNGLYVYESGVLQSFETESSVSGEAESVQYFDSANTLAYFDDRLWVGNTTEQGTRFTQRIRWSDPVNFSRFQPINYIDLPYGGGELIKLLPLGSLIVAYYTDAIYIGRPTNIATRPYLFERLETGKMGLVSQRAIVAWNDGHFFVGTDNIYTLTMSGALQTIGSPVLEETLEYTKSLSLTNFIQVEHDPNTESIVFIFPDVVEDTIEMKSIATKLWRLNYKTSGWSYDEVNFVDNGLKNIPNFYYGGLLPVRYYMSGRTWEDWKGGDDNNDESATQAWMPVMSLNPTERAEVPATSITNPDEDIFDSSVTDSFWDAKTWDNLKEEVLISKKLYLPIFIKGQKQVIIEELDRESDHLGETLPVDLTEITYPIWTVLESMDYDFGVPDQNKTITRLGCKIFDNQMLEFKDSIKSIIAELRFTLHLSDRMGYRWKRPISFGFKRSYNEGFANFRVTGSTFRYKLINGQEVPPYKISEMTLRVVGRGLQT